MCTCVAQCAASCAQRQHSQIIIVYTHANRAQYHPQTHAHANTRARHPSRTCCSPPRGEKRRGQDVNRRKGAGEQMRRKKSSSARETHTHTPSAWGRGQKSPEMRVSASTKIIAFLLHVLVHPACTVKPCPRRPARQASPLPPSSAGPWAWPAWIKACSPASFLCHRSRSTYPRKAK